MTSMQLKETTTYVVVDFTLNLDGKRKVDLVPRSWMMPTINGKWKCKFPLAKDYHLLKSWVPLAFDAKTSWKSYYCKIVKEAANYEQGVRRLNRAIPTDEVESTDIEREDDPVVPMILEDEALEDALAIVDEEETEIQTRKKRTAELINESTNLIDSPQTKKNKTNRQFTSKNSI